MDKSLPYCVAFSYFLGIGPVRFNALVKEFGSEEAAYTASGQDLSKVLGPKLVNDFEKFRNEFDIKSKLKEIKERNIAILIRNNDLFPHQLKNIADTPICLYVKGNLNSINFKSDDFVAIVGARRITSNGQFIAKHFSWELAQKGVIIVSGMALGIDTVAHTGALEAGGKTIAVLGCGVDIVYPPANKTLYERIIKNEGLIISEFPPGMTTLPGLFVARNRIVSGLSSGILVVEGSDKSGTLITARYAAEQGREVFAPPGPLSSAMSAAPNILLKQGAKIVFSPQDILEELGLKAKILKKEQKSLNLTKEEVMIFELLSHEPRPADEISSTGKTPLPQVLKALSLMEIKGVIEKNNEGKYQINPNSRRD